MSLIKKITKAVVLVPIHIAQGAVEAVSEAIDIMTGDEKKK